MLKRIIFQIQIHQLVEDVDDDQQLVDLPKEDDHNLDSIKIPKKLKFKYQHTYDHWAYGAWLAKIPFSKAYEIFTYYGH